MKQQDAYITKFKVQCSKSKVQPQWKVEANLLQGRKMANGSSELTSRGIDAALDGVSIDIQILKDNLDHLFLLLMGFIVFRKSWVDISAY